MRVVVLLVLLGACADSVPSDQEPDDLEVDPPDAKADGLPGTFDQNFVIADANLVDATAVTAQGIQAFFENTPYGTRSWLASYSQDGVPAAELVVQAASAHEINPLVLVARMQVETTLVSRTAPPSARILDRALGCGCPDARACDTSYSGLREQLDCAADTLRRMYDRSVDGSGDWRRNRTHATLDGRHVTPLSHATAALYAYTPWVLSGTGGTWLVWNITRKYTRYANEAGLSH